MLSSMRVFLAFGARLKTRNRSQELPEFRSYRIREPLQPPIPPLRDLRAMLSPDARVSPTEATVSPKGLFGKIRDKIGYSSLIL
jgi:hypothetical protein